jgi:ATPase components of ABC transporters with duplicated ATPase domains
MNLLTIENLTKSYTERLIFDNTEFSMSDTDKVGVIGINGTGKSTLLKIIAGLEKPDIGNVTVSNGVKISYLSQTPSFDSKDTVLESVVKHFQGDYGEWEAISAAKTMLNKLGISDFEANVENLSGGQKKRVALARILLQPADLLVLDEPTNHLDSEMATWLEEYLVKFKGSIIMITHDRYFLDAVTERIVELDKGKLYSYDENYSGFLLRKAERESIEQASERKRNSILRVELSWIMRGARARSTKQKARIERYEELKNRAGITTTERVKLESVSSRLGRSTVEIEMLSKAYGDKELFKDFSYIFLKDDRIGIVGENGCGKSTLIKIIMGQIEADAGKINIGKTVKIGYFSQENEDLPLDTKVIDVVKEIAEYLQTPSGSISASMMLERFLFPSYMQYTQVGKLSGGERRRLALLRVLMAAPNILILDEPTNDLDITTLTVLEDYLDSFNGIVAVVSHDRYFLDRVVQRIFAFEEQTIVQYEGGYTDYRKTYDKKKTVLPSSAMTVKQCKNKSDVLNNEKNKRDRIKKLKFTYNEQKEFDTIEEVIKKIEDKLEKLEVEIINQASNYSKLQELMLEKESTELLLEEKMDRWVYLEELSNKINEQ